MSKFFRNTLIYFLLVIGYIAIYIIDIERVCYKNEDVESTSKVNFIYQQF
jgi:hypothetical protein